MTQKEELYMEDGINHVKNLNTMFTNFSNEVEDSALANFITRLANKNESLSEKLLKVMEDISHE